MSGEKPAGVLVGQKGVKYGLQKVAPKKPGQLGMAQKPAGNAPRKLTPGNVFGDDDSEEEDVEKQIARQAEKKRAAAKVGPGPGLVGAVGTHSTDLHAGTPAACRHYSLCNSTQPLSQYSYHLPPPPVRARCRPSPHVLS